MIFDSLSHAKAYRALPGIYRALTLVRQYGETLPPDGLETEDGRIRLSRLTIQTKEAALCRYEAHRNWIDIHCALRGTEVVHVQDVALLQALVPFDAASDIGFYEGAAQSVCRVGEGRFLVCFPQDAHKVCIMDGAPAEAEKIVAKVRMDV